jgi:hypothetical protein
MFVSFNACFHFNGYAVPSFPFAWVNFGWEGLLTVYFGTPSMFITLWFGFDYGTNPPLGTLII